MFSKGNRDRISFAVEAPPVFTPSHMGTIMAIIMGTIMAIMAELVAADLLIFIETCVF